MAKVLHDNFGIVRGYMVTIHAYTGDQNTVDTLHKDLHRARAAAVSAIPTSTGAARAVGLVMPELKGKLDGTAIRIPTPNVSLVSLDVNLKKPATKDEINAAMQDASKGALRGILDYNTAPLVSIDFNHSPASLHLRCDADRRGGWRTDPGDGLVRQRVGLLEPHVATRPRCSGACKTSRPLPLPLREGVGGGGRPRPPPLPPTPSRKGRGSVCLRVGDCPMAFRTLDNVDVAGKRVLLRADLNVPVRDGKITDLTRIERLTPTIRELVGKGARVIVCSHFDRPKGKRVPEMSLAPIADALGEVLGQRVRFAEDCVGVPAEQAVERMARGDVLVLENTRFHAEEEKNDPGFAAAWRSSPTSM